MKGHAFAIMGTSGDVSAPEHGLEGSNSISVAILSSRRDHGDRAEGTVRAQKKRKVRTPWSDKNTQQLLRAYRKRMDESGRSFMTSADWQSISESVDGKAGIDCQRRMDTLTKSFNKINDYCAASHKLFSQLSEGEKRSLKLATKMKADWYYQMFEIKEQPQNAMVVQSPDSADQNISSSPGPEAVMVFLLSMAGFSGFSPLSLRFLLVTYSPSKSKLGAEDEIHGEVVGTPEPAWAARDPPRSISPTDLQGHCSAAPGLPTLADPPYHPDHSVNCVGAWIETLLCSPPHAHPPVDLSESSHISGVLEHHEHLRIASNIFEGHENFEHAGDDIWTWWTLLMRSNESLCLDFDAGGMGCF